MGEREGPVVPVASVSGPHIYSGNTRTCTHDLSTTAVEAVVLVRRETRERGGEGTRAARVAAGGPVQYTHSRGLSVVRVCYSSRQRFVIVWYSSRRRWDSGHACVCYGTYGSAKRQPDTREG